MVLDLVEFAPDGRCGLTVSAISAYSNMVNRINGLNKMGEPGIHGLLCRTVPGSAPMVNQSSA